MILNYFLRGKAFQTRKLSCIYIMWLLLASRIDLGAFLIGGVKVINLGTIKEITDLRSVWPHESLNFTPWVAENVDLLADAVGLDVAVDETESSVGDFNVDIYASETGTDRKIIIENQLEDTDHDHLGKLITYASGKGAGVVIWVVKHAREEHNGVYRCRECLRQYSIKDW